MELPGQYSDAIGGELKAESVRLKNYENFIVRALRPFRIVPMNLVCRAYRIKMPKSFDAKKITLKDFIRQSLVE